MSQPFFLPPLSTLPSAVAHILQSGDMYGEGEGPIRPEQMTSEVGGGDGARRRRSRQPAAWLNTAGEQGCCQSA